MAAPDVERHAANLIPPWSIIPMVPGKAADMHMVMGPVAGRNNKFV